MFKTLNGALAFAWLTVTGSAQAEDSIPEVEISWQVLDGTLLCPSAELVTQDVKSRIRSKQEVVITGTSPTITAAVRSQAQGMVAEITLRDHQGQEMGFRTVETDQPDCLSLARASALAMALMIDSAAWPKEESKTLVEVSPAANPESEAVATPDDPTPRLRMLLAVGGGLGIGLLPAASAVIQVRGDVTGEHWGVTVSPFFLPEQSFEESGTKLGWGLTAVSFGPCYHWGRDARFSFAACAEAAVGALHVTVDSPIPVEPGDRLWLAAGPEVRVSHHVGHFHAALAARLVVPLMRHDFSLLDDETGQETSLYVQDPLGFIASIELGYFQ